MLNKQKGEILRNHQHLNLWLAILVILVGINFLACNQEKTETLNIDKSLSAEESLDNKTAGWPHWRGPSRNSIVNDTNWNPAALNGAVKFKWKVNVGKGFSSVSVKNGFLYTVGNQKNRNIVYCLDAETGKAIWKFSYDCRRGQWPGPKATPAIDGETLYVFSQEGHLHALHTKTGKVIWEKFLPRDFSAPVPMWGYSSSPVIDGNRLILNAGKSGIAIDKRTGEEIWNSGPGRPGYATAVLFNDNKLAAFFSSRRLYAVDVQTGEVVWSYPWITNPDVNVADPLVVGNRVFISSDYGRGGALLEITDNTPRVVWENTNMASHFSSFVYIDGYIYGNSGSAVSRRGAFLCVDIETGDVQWSENQGLGSLMAAGDKLILLTDRGKLSVAEINPEVYREIASTELPRGLYWPPPVLVNGHIFIRNHEGDVMCIDVSR